MTAEFHWWGLDTQFTASGDDATATAIVEINQRIVRELLTAPGEYVWQPGYGAGLGSYVGQALSAEKFAEIQAVIRSVVVKQPDVQKLPPPAMTFQNDANGLLAVEIMYTYAPTGQPVTVSIPLTS